MTTPPAAVDAVPEASSQVLSRRNALSASLAAGMGAVLALTGAKPAQAAPGGLSGLTTGVRDRVGTRVPAALPAGGAKGDGLLHLLRRTTFGLTPELVAKARAQGPDRWLEAQLDPTSINDLYCDTILARWPSIVMTAVATRAAYPGSRQPEAGNNLVRASIARAVWSERQLLEVMVEFWSNHLNITTPSEGVDWSRSTDDRDVVRRNALGKFSDMLVASGTSAAMLIYLNNATSQAKSPNENYGRELLELHTVGIDAGFTEADVKASTLLLTGFSIDWNLHVFRYVPEWHHVGPLEVLGFRHENATAAGGLEAGTSYLRYLASHPATARHLATKLCLRFVSDTPPPALVARLAQAYLSADTAIVPVLRMLFTSPEFAASAGAKQRRPLEDMVAMLRTLRVGPDPDGGTRGLDALQHMADLRGQAPFGWHPPDGYPDVAAAWATTLSTKAQWNDRLNIGAGWYPRELQVANLKALLPKKLPTTAGALVDALSARLLGQRLVGDDRAAVLEFLGKTAAQAPAPASTSSQLPYLVATILDSPAWSAR